MKIQIIFLTIFFVAFTMASNFVCQPGVAYKENNCNTCICNNGMLSCTLMMCSNPTSTKMAECKVGTTSKIRCNDCWCVENYGTLCTNRKCF